MAILKDLIVNGASRFIGKLTASTAEITDETVTTINGVTVGNSPQFTDTTALGSMTGTLGVDHGGTGQTSAVNAANALINSLTTGSATPSDNDYYISQYAAGGTTTTTYHRRPVSALWTYILGKINSVLGLTATTYGGSAAKVNNHTVQTDVPANAVFTDTTYTPASANPLMDGTVAVGTSAKYAREDHRHPSDTAKVSMSGNETVAGNKTFSGTTSLTADSIYPASVNIAIPSNAAAIIQSPIPKYLWHDVLAFCRDSTPTYYTTTDGTTWTEATLNKNLFMHKMTWGKQNVISDTIKGSRWLWTTNAWAYSSAAWLLIGVSYSATNAYFDITLEAADSSDNWTTLLTKTKCYYNSVPVWFKTNTPQAMAKLRLTVVRNAEDTTTNVLPFTSIRWLASRWGDQGRGEELEYPYQWDTALNIYPVTNNASTLGTSSYKWSNVYTNGINGTTVPSSPKFTDTTYTANTSKLVTTTVPNVTSVGSAPTLGTAISADDITAWTTNTPTSFTVSGEKLSITTGTAASLSYTSRSIPNVTSVGSAPTLGTAVTVATGSLSASGGGGTVATGITAS